jgi:hypothetical protein
VKATNDRSGGRESFVRSSGSASKTVRISSALSPSSSLASPSPDARSLYWRFFGSVRTSRRLTAWTTAPAANGYSGFTTYSRPPAIIVTAIDH